MHSARPSSHRFRRFRFASVGVALAVLFGTPPSGLRAEIPLACTPPTVERYAPPLLPVSYGPPGRQEAFWIGVYCDPQGGVTATMSEHLPDDVRGPLLSFVNQSTWRAAHDLDAPTWGFRRQRIVGYLAPVENMPVPTPRFSFDEATREKLEAIAQTAVKGWLRLRLEVDRHGNLSAVRSTNQALGQIVEKIFATLPSELPPFLPATDGDRKVESTIDLWWDLTLPSDRKDFAEAETALVELGANAFPGAFPDEAAARSTRAWVFPAPNSCVAGAFLQSDIPSPLALPLLRRLSQWYIPPRNVGFPLEVSLDLRPDDESVVVGAFRSIEETSTSLTMSARPIYPKRRFLPDPDGFVRFRITVEKDGLIGDWEILEASSDRFRQPALEALAEWKFKPRLFDGKPVPAVLFYTMPFRPNRNPQRE